MNVFFKFLWAFGFSLTYNSILPKLRNHFAQHFFIAITKATVDLQTQLEHGIVAIIRRVSCKGRMSLPPLFSIDFLWHS